MVRVVHDDESGDLAEATEPIVTVDGLRALLTGLSAAQRARTVAVVASLGHYDEVALDALLDANLGFVGLGASRKRAARVFGVLAQQGRSPERLASVHNPVGLDIGARTPGDVAVSILAQIVGWSPPLPAPATDDADAATLPFAVDPICGMDVEVDGARHHFELNGQTYYFCGAGCRAAFAADPAAALPSTGSA